VVASRPVIRGVTALALVPTLLFASRASAQVDPSAPASIAVGEWQVAPLFDVRTRGEVRHDLDDHDRAMVLERVRIGVEAEQGGVEARVVLQDARALTLAAGTNFVEGPPPGAVTGAFEGWVEAHDASLRPSFVRLGRQPIVWGEGRLLGVADWSIAGRSLDAIRGRLTLGEGAVEVLATVLEDTPPTGVTAPTAYGELFGVRAEWAFDPLFSVEAVALARLAQATPAGPANPTADLGGSARGQTYAGALRLWGDGQAWTWGAEVAYELGRADVLSANRAAWALAAHLARKLDHVMSTPTLRVGLSYASGDKGTANGGTYRAFDPLLPDTHVWHGAMDVFAWSNEEEVNARVGIVPFVDGEASVEYRYARLAEAAGDWSSGYLTTIGEGHVGGAEELGHEVDASLGWSPWVAVHLIAGYSALVLGDGARAILGAQAPHVSQFAFADASVKF